MQVGAFDDIMIDDTTSKFGRGTTYNSNTYVAHRGWRWVGVHAAATFLAVRTFFLFCYLVLSRARDFILGRFCFAPLFAALFHPLNFCICMACPLCIHTPSTITVLGVGTLWCFYFRRKRCITRADNHPIIYNTSAFLSLVVVMYLFFCIPSFPTL